MITKPFSAACGLLVGASALFTGCVVSEPSRVVTVREESYTPGYVVRSLPPGYTVRRYQNEDYYVANNVYYRRVPTGYSVVEAPFGTTRVSNYRAGYVTETLPSGYTVRRHRGRDYYVADNVWYRPHRRGYVVVNAPL
mgnify:CR=1 FL=1|jgi:hypothetical protein